MKYFSVILAIIVLGLTAQPCSDGFNFEDQHVTENSDSHNHNHKEDSDDSCSTLCSCSCCGTVIVFEKIFAYNYYIPQQKISTKLNSNYQSNYFFDMFTSIWHPPKMIS